MTDIMTCHWPYHPCNLNSTTLYCDAHQHMVQFCIKNLTVEMKKVKHLKNKSYTAQDTFGIVFSLMALHSH